MSRVVFHYSIERSCRSSIVMIEESAEPLASDDPAWLSFWNALDQPIAETLMGSLAVVVLHVLRDRAPEWYVSGTWPCAARSATMTRSRVAAQRRA